MIVDLDRAVRRLEPSGKWSDPAPLSTYRYAPAYVLLGDPGAGKTTSFEREAHATPNAQVVTARDFRTFGMGSRPEGVSTLFLDGLDEVRAGSGDPRGPFDSIRTQLAGPALQRVRLACRMLDWRGRNDRTNLAKVVPGGEVLVLRLDRLNMDEQARVVEVLQDVPDASEFLTQAASASLEGLLANPQSLVLLARVVAGNGAFPKGRTETFQRACRLLVQEQNEEHRIAAPLPEPETLVEAAGHMCAVTLLSGSVGFSLPGVPESDGFLPTSRLGAAAADAEHAAHTRLFTGVGSRRFAPVHANVAAFLAARRLARLVDGPVPARRVLALLTGADGIPPTPLRALVAWLAALSRALRRPLIQLDPVAVLMYGDVREFEPSQRALVLDEIERDVSRLHDDFWPDSAVEGVASADMESKLRSVLLNRDRSEPKQRVVALVATALAVTPLGQRLSGLLANVVRDETHSLGVRRRALDAWVRAFEDMPDRMHRQRELLAQVREAEASDPCGELMATLLRALYPNGLSPSELWDYFPSHPMFPQGLLSEFWQHLSRDCPEDHLTSHLDRLGDLIPSVRPAIRERFLHDVPLRLLARALETRGDEIDASQLFRWLLVGLDEAHHLNDRGSEAKALIARVRRWLENHPALQKDVIRVALRSDEFRPRGTVEGAIRELLYRSELPDEVGAWHLDQAVLTASTNGRLMDFHIQELLASLAATPVHVDEALASARKRLAASPEAIRRLEAGLKSELPEDYLVDAQEYQRARAPDSNLLHAVRRSKEPLRQNRANPVLLHELARLYYAGAFIEGEATDRERLLKALNGDEELTQAAIAGIRSSPDREDLPSVERVLRLRTKQEADWLTLPVLVGLTERSVGDVLALDQERLAAILALRLARPSSDEDAPWYLECLRQRSSLVAEVLLRFGRVVLAAGEKHLPDLYHLSRKPGYAEVARKVTMPLLRAFPVRARADQHELLVDLLQSALAHCDRTTLRDLIERKTALGSVTKTQRLYWLAAGLALDANRFGPLLAEAGDAYARCQVLERMFPPAEASVHEVPGLTEDLEPAALEFLIRELGAQRNPLPYDAGVSFGWGWGNALGVEHLIGRLGASPDKTAAEALERLTEEPSVSRWKRDLQRALETQRVVRRDADHTPPRPAAVVAALDDGPPANAADLRELVLDRLDRIAEELRTTDANLWQQFWSEDTDQPRHENICRDVLLYLLRHRLPEGCSAEKEGQFAADRRADIRAASGKWCVPVEIKKNSHRDLWRAVRNQLLPRYTNDATTEGLGIYLVLWFGPDRTAAVAEGRKPEDPGELRARLVANLTPEERRRAAIVVMDVTPP